MDLRVGTANGMCMCATKRLHADIRSAHQIWEYVLANFHHMSRQAAGGWRALGSNASERRAAGLRQISTKMHCMHRSAERPVNHRRLCTGQSCAWACQGKRAYALTACMYIDSQSGGKGSPGLQQLCQRACASKCKWFSGLGSPNVTLQHAR